MTDSENSGKRVKDSETLDIVQECDELSNSASPVHHEHCKGFFGVKSYLHNFYECVSVKNPQIYEEYEEYRYLIAPKERQRTIFFWKFVFWLGFFLLLFGAILLMAGYLVPRMNIDVGYHEEMRIIDRAAYLFNQNLEWCKIIGLAIFCIGGTLLSASLLLPSLVGLSCLDDDSGDESTPFKLRIVDEECVDTGGVVGINGCGGASNGDSNNKNGIPATESLKSVQPKREDKIIITHSGLTHVE